MIHASGLAKAFAGHVVLDGLSLTVAAGERVALLGLNGTGKTTLFRCLLGQLPYEGELLIDGLDARRDGRRVRARVGYVPQRPPHFYGTLGDLAVFFGGLRGLDLQVVARRMDHLDLSLEDHAAKPVSALSGGMLQKTLLALATAAEVPLLLLDEPTANLDPRARREFVRALESVSTDTTVFLSSHRLEDIRAVADRLLLLHSGRLVFDGTIEELEATARAGSTLWVGLSDDALERAAQAFASDPRVVRVRRNGSRVGLEAASAELPGLLAELDDLGLEVLDLRTEAPSLERLLAGFVDEDAS